MKEVQSKAGVACKITQSVTQAQLKFLSRSHAFSNFNFKLNYINFSLLKTI